MTTWRTTAPGSSLIGASAGTLSCGNARFTTPPHALVPQIRRSSAAVLFITLTRVRSPGTPPAYGTTRTELHYAPQPKNGQQTPSSCESQTAGSQTGAKKALVCRQPGAMSCQGWDRRSWLTWHSVHALKHERNYPLWCTTERNLIEGNTGRSPRLLRFERKESVPSQLFPGQQAPGPIQPHGIPEAEPPGRLHFPALASRKLRAYRDGRNPIGIAHQITRHLCLN